MKTKQKMIRICSNSGVLEKPQEILETYLKDGWRIVNYSQCAENVSISSESKVYFNMLFLLEKQYV